ncbi:MAG TPA: AmmeMemoRadiSam system protein A [Burkholderiales bacterium]|nr:AmmeMemoRadiSam system protein A [Burkholderiales bacterium]
MLPTDAGHVLLPIARAAIGETLGQKIELANSLPGWLHENAACFVTLHRHGELRGCIGTIEAYRPLIKDVKANAVSAAMRDPRFTPLQRAEFEHIDIEVSVLSPTEAMSFSDELDVLSQIRIGVDGLVLEWRGHRGTFLPQVWESLPNKQDFLQQLKRKAGLPANFWAVDLNLYRYTV